MNQLARVEAHLDLRPGVLDLRDLVGELWGEPRDHRTARVLAPTLGLRRNHSRERLPRLGHSPRTLPRDAVVRESRRVQRTAASASWNCLNVYTFLVFVIIAFPRFP